MIVVVYFHNPGCLISPLVISIPFPEWGAAAGEALHSAQQGLHQLTISNLNTFNLRNCGF